MSKQSRISNHLAHTCQRAGLWEYLMHCKHTHTTCPRCSNGKKTQPVTILMMGCYRVCWLTHLSVRKNITRHHTHLAAPIKVMSSLSVWRSHLHFPSAAFIPSNTHIDTNGEEKQQLEQHLYFTPVRERQLSLFISAGMSEQVDWSLWKHFKKKSSFSKYWFCSHT